MLLTEENILNEIRTFFDERESISPTKFVKEAFRGKSLTDVELNLKYQSLRSFLKRDLKSLPIDIIQASVRIMPKYGYQYKESKQ